MGPDCDRAKPECDKIFCFECVASPDKVCGIAE